MKIKILLFPLIILVIFYLVVAHIFPDWQKVKELKVEIAGNELVMESIVEQQRNVDALFTQITSETQRKDDLGEIIPHIRTEETIINAAHQLAQKYQVILLQMAFNDQNTKDIQQRSNALSVAKEYTDPGTLAVSVSVSGPYNSTKEFLDNFARIIRGSTPATISINRSESSDIEETQLEDRLNTEVTYNYPYLREVVLQESDMKTLQHGIQSQNQFNMTPIDEWIAMTNKDVSDLNLGEHGRNSSPFMP